MSHAQKYFFNKGRFYKSAIIQNDTMVTDTLPNAFIIIKKNKRFFQRWRYRRLIYNLKKVYPYIKIAGDEMDGFNEIYLRLETKKEKKAYAKEVEKKLLSNYEDQLRKLTITQGKLMVKLLHRQTGLTSFEILKEFRGNFSAHFWQTLARIFGNNLKAEYDPKGEDKDIEMLIEMLEAGLLGEIPTITSKTYKNKKKSKNKNPEQKKQPLHK